MSTTMCQTKSMRTYRPRVNIVETDAEIVVTAEMPGVDETSTEIEIEKDLLTISGTIAAVEMEGYELAYSEFEPGRYERQFKLSDQIDRERIDATVKNGMLRLALPKVPERVPKKVSVKAG